MTHRLGRGWIFSVAAFVFAADRLTKHLVVNNLSAAKSVRVIPDFFHITLVMNRGAAFGILKDSSELFVLMTIVAVALILVYVFRSRTMSAAIASALGLILGGAAGNLIDRIRFGYVIDFLDFRVWPVFNVADSAISVGAAILILSLFFNIKGQSSNAGICE